MPRPGMTIEKETTMTYAEAIELIDEYEADPNDSATCDNLCAVADALDLPEGEYQPDELRDAAWTELGLAEGEPCTSPS